MGLYLVSSIQSQPIMASETGVAQGRMKMSGRTIAGEVLGENDGEDIGEDQDEDLRDEGEADGGFEDLRKISFSQTARYSAGRRIEIGIADSDIREAESDRQQEGEAHQEDNVEQGRRQNSSRRSAGYPADKRGVASEDLGQVLLLDAPSRFLVKELDVAVVNGEFIVAFDIERCAHIRGHFGEGQVLVVATYVAIDQAVGAEVFDPFDVVVEDARIIRIVVQRFRQEVLGAKPKRK